MYCVVVMRQTTPIASYGPFNSLDAANEFARIYLDHEASVHVTAMYRYLSDYHNRDEMKFV